MSRIIALFDPIQGLKGTNSDALVRGALFLESQTADPLQRTWVEALEGRLQILVITRKDENEKEKIFIDPSSGLTVALDGSPQMGKQIFSAENLASIYLNNGPQKMAKKLDGGWAAIIADQKLGKVMVFRDRVGLKPFYHAKNNGLYMATSSAGALVRTGLLPSQMNPNTIARYASGHYRTIYGRPEIFFKDIFLLEPATILEIDLSGHTYLETYWALDPGAPYLDLPPAEMEDLYRSHLRRMIENYLSPREGKKWAVSLSGGIDSGSIIGLLHHQTGARVPAISMSYKEETPFDEGWLIAYSVRDHASDWHDVKLDYEILGLDLPGLYKRFDQPLATISIYGYDYLYREASKLGMQVLFTGGGGDHPQAGAYPNFLYFLADLKVKDKQAYEHEVSCWVKNHSTERYPKTRQTAEDYFSKYLDLSVPGKLKANTLLLSEGLLDPDFELRAGSLATHVVPNYGDYMRTYLVQEHHYDALAPGVEPEDVIGWSWGTDMTSPYFCKEVVEFGWIIPLHYKIANGVNKVLARRALRGIVADEILDRVDKSGFNAPFDLWIRGPLKDLAMDIFTCRSFQERGIYHHPAINRIIDDHISGRANHMMLMWQALNLELWLREWIDR